MSHGDQWTMIYSQPVMKVNNPMTLCFEESPMKHIVIMDLTNEDH